MTDPRDPIREALDLGLQAWRTTPVREKFMSADAHGQRKLLRASALVWINAAIYSRMATGGARTYADWLWIEEAR